MSSSNTQRPANTEKGDEIINWHLQYCAAILIQGEGNIRYLSDLVKAELSKIKIDFEFVKKLQGPHNNLMRLKATDNDLKNLLDNLKEISDLLRKLSSRSAQRII